MAKESREDGKREGLGQSPKKTPTQRDRQRGLWKRLRRNKQKTKRLGVTEAMGKEDFKKN